MHILKTVKGEIRVYFNFFIFNNLLIFKNIYQNGMIFALFLMECFNGISVIGSKRSFEKL